MTFVEEFADWLAYATVSVKPFAGAGAWGDETGAAVAVPAWYDFQERRVTTADGSVVVTSTVLFAAPEWEASLQPGSEVTIPGKPDVYKVMSIRAWPNDDDNHVEVTLL